MAAFFITLVTFGIGTAVAFGLLFGVFIAICWAIRREDATGSLTGHPPTRACQRARYIAGWNRSRWA